MNIENQGLQTNQVTDFINEDRTQRLAYYKNVIYQTKHSLFIAAGLLLVGEIVSYAYANQFPGALSMLILAATFCSFLAFRFLANKKPYTAIKNAAIVFCIYIIIYCIPYIIMFGVEGILKGLLHGVIFKVIILTVLGKNAGKAREMQRLKEEEETESN